MKNKGLFLICFILIGIIFGLGYINQSYFEMICTICGFMFLGMQFRLFFYLEKDEELQRKKCKPLGFLFMLPAIGMIVNGIMIFKTFYLNMSLEMAYMVIILSIVLVVTILCQIILLWKNNVVAGRFIKMVSVAASLVPLSIIIVLTLKVTESDEAIALSCLTSVIFGSLALLIAINMSIVSICGYKSTKDGIKIIHKLIKNNKLHFIRISILKDLVLGVGKLIISVLSLSFFMFVNVLYTSGMGLARFVAVRMHLQDKKKQITSYGIVGIILTISSICYVLYSVRLFFGGKTGVYNMNFALVIALYTFIEFGINIREAFRLRKSKALEAKALRAISFSSTLISFVLTQTAIMSFAAEGDNSAANASSGVIFGGLATIVGLYVMYDSFSHRKLYKDEEFCDKTFISK